MGSSSKTVTQLNYSKLLPQDKDLFIENILRTAAKAHSIDTRIILPAMLRVNQYYNYRQFKKLDAASQVEGVTLKLDLKALYQKLGLSCTADRPVNTAMSSSVTDKFLWRAMGNTGSKPMCSESDTFNNNVFFRNISKLATGQLRGEKFTFTISSSGCTNITSQGYVTYPGIEEDIFVFTVEKNAARVGTTMRYRMLAKDAAIKDTSADISTILTLVYKSNFIKNDSKFIHAMNSNLGIPNKTPPNPDDPEDSIKDAFEDVLDNSNYKHVFLTYCVPYKDDYKKPIDAFYGNGKGISVKAHGITITCGLSHTVFGTPGPEQNYCDAKPSKPGASMPNSFRVDGKLMKLSGKDAPQFLLPIEWFANERTIREKHDDISKSLTMIIFAEKKVKLKWYQTGFFKIFMWVVAIGMAIYGYTGMLIGMIGSSVISAVFGDLGGMVFNLILSIWSFGTSVITSGFNMTFNFFQQIATLASQIASVYFKVTYDNIMDKIEDITDETKEITDKINEMVHDAIYMPIGDVLDSIYYSMYDLMYNGAYELPYRYDKLSSVNILQNYSKGTV